MSKVSTIFVLIFLFFAQTNAGTEGAKNKSNLITKSHLRCVEKLASGQNNFHVKINRKAMLKSLMGLQVYQKNLDGTQRVFLADYSISSKYKRGYLIDFNRCEVLANEYIAHGGTIYTPRLIEFADDNKDGILDRCTRKDGSRQYMTRPGFMVTAGCHVSQKNFPFISSQCKGIKLRGLEVGLNEDIHSKGVALHEHDLMPNDSSIKPEGQGCPIFPTGKLKELLKQDVWDGLLVNLYTPQCGT